MERCVCAPHSEPGGMESDPMESDSMRDGSCEIVSAASDLGADGDGRMEERTPGVNVVGANTCFVMVEVIPMVVWLQSREERGER